MIYIRTDWAGPGSSNAPLDRMQTRILRCRLVGTYDDTQSDSPKIIPKIITQSDNKKMMTSTKIVACNNYNVPK